MIGHYCRNKFCCQFKWFSQGFFRPTNFFLSTSSRAFLHWRDNYSVFMITEILACVCGVSDNFTAKFRFNCRPTAVFELLPPAWTMDELTWRSISEPQWWVEDIGLIRGDYQQRCVGWGAATVVDIHWSCAHKISSLLDTNGGVGCRGIHQPIW